MVPNKAHLKQIQYIYISSQQIQHTYISSQQILIYIKYDFKKKFKLGKNYY